MYPVKIKGVIAEWLKNPAYSEVAIILYIWATSLTYVKHNVIEE